MTVPIELPHGPLMIDVAGLELSDLDRERLIHPLVGGLILFARNYQSTAQLSKLTTDIHALRSPPLLIAIDHEGGRVQRCREGFTRLPPMRGLGELWERSTQQALAAAKSLGHVLATELRACGVDLSSTPVLDLDWGRSGVIGDRAFHGDPAVVAQLAGALIEGWVEAVLGARVDLVDVGQVQRLAGGGDEIAELAPDLVPYRLLKLDAIMPAHVIYTNIDAKPAGFSKYWHQYLRNNIMFDGVVFSDDLSMEGASIAGDIVSRVQAAWDAGCDMLLVCNAPDAVGDVLDRWHPEFDRVRSSRIARLMSNAAIPMVRDDPLYIAGVNTARLLCA